MNPAIAATIAAAAQNIRPTDNSGWSPDAGALQPVQLDAVVPGAATLTNVAAAGVAARPQDQAVASVVNQQPAEAQSAAPAALTTDAQYQEAWKGMTPEQIAQSINQTPGPVVEGAAGNPNSTASAEEYRLAWLAENQGNYMGPGLDPTADIWGAGTTPAATTPAATTQAPAAPSSGWGPEYASGWHDGGGPGGTSGPGSGPDGDGTGSDGPGGVGGSPGGNDGDSGNN